MSRERSLDRPGAVTAATNERVLSPGATLRNWPIAHLRTFLTILVVSHHAATAYFPFAPPHGQVFNGTDDLDCVSGLGQHSVTGGCPFYALE
jgi:hypothetical protein